VWRYVGRFVLDVNEKLVIQDAREVRTKFSKTFMTWFFPVGEDKFVYKIVDGKAKLTKVVTGTRREGRVEIVEGLAAGDEVVTAGQLKIRDGSALSVVAATGA